MPKTLDLRVEAAEPSRVVIIEARPENP